MNWGHVYRARLGQSGRWTLLIVITIIVFIALFLLTSAQPIISRFSKATAYASLIYLGATLVIGALRVLRGIPNPNSSYLRREIGITAGTLAVVHAVLGLQVHFGGDFVQYFLYRLPNGFLGFRRDFFGLANELGLLALAIVLILLGFSNDISVRRLGLGRWKKIQKLSYVSSILIFLHGLIYQMIEKRSRFCVFFLIVLSGAVAAIQFAGFCRYRESRRRRNECLPNRIDDLS